MNRNIWRIIVYILNDFKRAYNITYSNLSASTRDNLCTANLMINDMRLIKNLQTNAFFIDIFVKNFLITASKVDIRKTDISTSSIRAIVFKFSTLEIVSVTFRKSRNLKRLINSISQILSRSLLTRFHLKYNFLILTKAYSPLLLINKTNLRNINFNLSLMKMF